MNKIRYWKYKGDVEAANLNLNCKIQPDEVVGVEDKTLFNKFVTDPSYEEVEKDGSPLKKKTEPKTKKATGDQ